MYHRVAPFEDFVGSLAKVGEISAQARFEVCLGY
jgi:hypothetical protein